jgi:Holliday junction DNA helicase RuvB
MSQPDAQTAPNYVTCPCQYCSGKIEFDANQLDAAGNTTVPCPHCGLETIVFLPPIEPSSDENLSLQPVFQEERKQKSAETYGVLIQIVGVFLCLSIVGIIVGIPLIIWGSNLGKKEREKRAAERNAALAQQRSMVEAEQARKRAAYFASPEYFAECLAVLSLNEKTTPSTFEHFIGQDRVKAEIAQAYEAARNSERRSPHILFVGLQGMGKSTLALLIARANAMSSGATCKVIDAQKIPKIADLAGILTNLEDGDVLFIDHIDELDTTTRNALKSAIVDFKFQATFEDEDADAGYRTISLNLPHFTFVATTTKKDELSPLLIAGFPLVVKFDNYSVEEITAITNKLAGDLGFKIDADAIQLIGSSANRPWIVSYLLELVRVYAQARESSERITFDMVTQALKTMESDEQAYQRREGIPSEVKREVWRRDEGKCAKCGSRENLEYDHIIPVVKGGSNTVRNIELLCEACNRAKSDTIQ